MLRLNRYIAAQVAAAILLVLAVLLGLDLVSQVIDQSGDLSARYTLLSALWYALLSVPGQLMQYLPFAALIGSLAGLGALASTSELVVIRTAGVSVARILWMALKPALLITLAGMLVAEYVAPGLKQMAESHRAIALQRDQAGISRYGLWHREGHSFVHLNAVQPNGVLHGVSIYTLDDRRQLRSALHASRAIYQQGHWLLEDVRETRFLGEHLEQRTASRKVWQTQLSPELLNILVLDPEDLSMVGLWRYTHFLREQGANSGEYELAFWNKVLQPLAIVGLVLLAASIVFGPLRQASMGQRVFIGVLIGVSFRISQDMLGPASLVFGFAPLLAALAPIIAAIVGGAFLLGRRS